MSSNNKLYKQQYSYNNSDNQSDNEIKENKKQISIKTYLVWTVQHRVCVCACVCVIPVLRFKHSKSLLYTQDTVSNRNTNYYSSKHIGTLLVSKPHKVTVKCCGNGCVHLKCLQLVQKLWTSASVKPWDVLYSLHFTNTSPALCRPKDCFLVFE